jgi:hypothetical protein
MVNGGLGNISKKFFVAYFSVIFQLSRRRTEENEESKRIPPENKYKAILLH